jgi:spore maturation protein SpmB
MEPVLISVTNVATDFGTALTTFAICERRGSVRVIDRANKKVKVVEKFVRTAKTAFSLSIFLVVLLVRVKPSN